jgi:hypothetical protein
VADALPDQAGHGAVLVIVCVSSPDKRATNSNTVSPVALLLEGLCIIIRDPLVAVKDQVIDSCFFIVNRFQAGKLGQDSLNLVVHQNTASCRAWSSSGTTAELASRRGAAWVYKLERSSIEAKTHKNLLRLDADTPKQLRSQFDFGKVGMALYDAADWVVAIPFIRLVSAQALPILGQRYSPGTVEIVAHQIGPVSVLHHVRHIEPPKVPVGRRHREGNAQLPWRGVKSRAERLHHRNIVFGILGFSTAIRCTRVFPVDVKTLDRLAHRIARIFLTPLTHQNRNDS